MEDYIVLVKGDESISQFIPLADVFFLSRPIDYFFTE